VSHTFKHPLAQGLVYEDRLPLGWRVLDRLPDENALTHLNEFNESFLKIFATLEDQHVPNPEAGDSHAEIQHELMRIDLKVNLLLDLVGHVLSRQLDLPERVLLRVGAQGMEWEGDSLPAEGCYIKVELYLYPRYPRPLELIGQVISVQAQGECGRVTVVFVGVSETVEDWIDKIIFRHHRRSIAHRRIPQPSRD
jgi:Atypical PilZ domain, cyclic di-GMP receptor